MCVQRELDTMSVDSETAMAVETPAGGECVALRKFWSDAGLLHKSEQLRAWLGTEVMEDMDFVYPHDLQTMRADQWAGATLTIAEFNRLKKAVSKNYARMITAEDASAGFVATWQAEQGASGCANAAV